MNYELQDSLISQAFIDKAHISRQYSKDNRTTVADYVFNDPGNQQWHSGRSVFSMITGITNPKIAVYEIIKVTNNYLIVFLNSFIHNLHTDHQKA